MASYKVTSETGLKHKGKDYAKGDSITLNKDAAATYERLDWIKESTEKKAGKGTNKGARKGAAKTATKTAVKGADEVIETPDPVTK